MSSLYTTLDFICFGVLAFAVWDASRKEARSAQQIRRLKRALLDIYHEPNAPDSVRQQAMKAIKEGGAE